MMLTKTQAAALGAVHQAFSRDHERCVIVCRDAADGALVARAIDSLLDRMASMAGSHPVRWATRTKWWLANNSRIELVVPGQAAEAARQVRRDDDG